MVNLPLVFMKGTYRCSGPLNRLITELWCLLHIETQFRAGKFIEWEDISGFPCH